MSSFKDKFFSGFSQGIGVGVGFRGAEYVSDLIGLGRNRQKELSDEKWITLQQKQFEQKRKDFQNAQQLRLQDNYENRMFIKEEKEKDRRAHEDAQFSNQLHEIRMQEMQNESARERMDTDIEIARMYAETIDHNAELDRQTQLYINEQQLDCQERLEQKRLFVQQQLANQNARLQEYLSEQKIKNDKEIALFNALAIRETQILASRENAKNILQDRLVQESLKTFPLNISPLVLLKNRPHSLNKLLKFSLVPRRDCHLPDIADVYDELKEYAKNPEPLNVFIAPLHISSLVIEGESLNRQIWDIIYQKLESFFTLYYNRRSDHPVVLYPTAWKEASSAGSHSSETLHFFLKDIPCLVLEPRFNGNSFGIIISGWNNGYLDSEQIRTQANFDINIQSELMFNAYSRSKTSLKLLEKLGENITSELIERKKKLERNILYYETLNLEKVSIQEIESLGIQELFDISPSLDLEPIAERIASLLCLNIAVIADIHHLLSTDAPPIFPKIFKEIFSNLYENQSLREMIARCYESVLIFLRSKDVVSLIDFSHRRELERVREQQIKNIYINLDLFEDSDIQQSIELQIKEYISEKTGIKTILEGYELWNEAIDLMSLNDIPFFQEILPVILDVDETLHRRIDKKIAELQR